MPKVISVYMRIRDICIFLALLIHSDFSLGQYREALTIYFESNSYEIGETSGASLNKVAGLCSSSNFQSLKIFAFSDTTGTEEYNLEISKMRAIVVLNYLKGKVNFEDDKIYATWLGESDDIYDLHFDNAHAQERCVDLLIQFQD